MVNFIFSEYVIFFLNYSFSMYIKDLVYWKLGLHIFAKCYICLSAIKEFRICRASNGLGKHLKQKNPSPWTKTYWEGSIPVNLLQPLWNLKRKYAWLYKQNHYTDLSSLMKLSLSQGNQMYSEWYDSPLCYKVQVQSLNFWPPFFISFLA